jgi:hypothetical protein
LTAAGKSGVLPASEIAKLAHANTDLTSIQSIDSLPQDVQGLVRDAFRNGTRWAFISLIPWCGVAIILTYFLSQIPDSDQVLEVAEKGEKASVKGSTSIEEPEKESRQATKELPVSVRSASKW